MDLLHGSFAHFSIITIVFFVTWINSLWGGFVSDDHDGIERFSDKLRVAGFICRLCSYTWAVEETKGSSVCPKCHIDKSDAYGDKIDSYELEVGPEKKKLKFRNIQFNPHIMDLLHGSFAHFSIITIVFFVTWINSLWGGFVSDDHDGIERFSDKLRVAGFICRLCSYTWAVEETKGSSVCPKCHIDKSDAYGDKIDSYELEVGPEKKKLKFRNIQFNPHIGFPFSILRWARHQIGKKFTVIGRTTKGHEIFGFTQNPLRHHLLSLITQLLNSFLTYTFLSKLFGSDLALLTTLLFLVNPISCQAVAWCSGFGYLLNYFGLIVTFNLALSSILFFPNSLLIAFFTLISCSGLMSAAANWAILAFIGKPIYALISFWIAFGFGIKIFSWHVDYRKDAFKSQNMGESTYLTRRKPILMVKTFAYYVELMIWPWSLGLFNTFGYHFDETLERFDFIFWRGVVYIILLGLLFYFAPFTVRLGLLWFSLYLCLFLNVITAQQFVVDRYAFNSILGFSLVAAYYLKDFPILYGTLLGLYIMRTWVHIPTFKDEESFYKSNIWNFPKSEVAMGNLGVVLANSGRQGSALDVWLQAAKVNPFYDVPYYNLYSLYKSAGQFSLAKDALIKCLNAKVVHFDKLWSKEMNQLELMLYLMKPMEEHLKSINRGVTEAHYERYRNIRFSTEVSL